MIAHRRDVICLLIFGPLAACLLGCDEKLHLYPFSKPVLEEHGFATPTARILSLQELAKKAPETTDPGQRESICRDLAQQIRKELDSNIRSEILRTIAAYGPGETADAVLKLAARDTDADVRVIVCSLWGKRDDPAAAEILINVLASDADKDVRMAAVRGLGHMHGEAVQKALGGTLEDPDPAMKYLGMVALHDSTGKDFGATPSDVDRWRQYVKTGQEPEIPLAERIFWWYR